MVQIRTLQLNDKQRLHEFEVTNRAWFEQFIPPRNSSLYTPDGTEEHIIECLTKYIQQIYHPNVLVDAQGNIIGRANLIDIDKAAQCCKIGYRIAQHHVGTGLATMAVAELKVLAQQWGVLTLNAYVSVENPASARVLEKSRFVRGERVVGMAVLKDKTLDCDRYTFFL
jgi:[ribosomal protein S5]-alanine N-acetyltransferase